MEIRLADFINANTENSQMKNCQCLIYAMIYRPNLQNLQTRKNSWNNWLKVDIGFSIYATTKQSAISTLYIYVQNKMYVLYTRPDVCRPEKR